MKSTRFLRSPLIWILLGFLAIAVIFDVVGSSSGYTEEPTSKVVSLINADTPLKEVVLVDGEQTIRLETKDDPPVRMRTSWVGTQSEQIIERLNQRVAAGSLETWKGENPQPSFWSTFLFSVLPFLVIGVLFFMMFNNLQGGGNRVMGFGKSKAKLASKDTPKTTFADVAGCEEAIEELQEIREFLSEPAKFQAVGAKIPKGVLLYGPPGTGKTLLARAVAGEAGVPFFSISGSDFVEMFVGVGASRVRDLFEQAKEAAPAIVFIDEIDAVGRHRGAGMGGGHDEREQTLNQLLVEMDGFDVHGGVVLIAATNRPDVLDPALLRPGRFDRQIPVEAPDMKGRLQILRVHGANKPLAPDADLESVAKRTPGFTGADLANVLNEAALLTARQNNRFIGKGQLDEAIDRVIAGPQKRSRVMNERELLITAYHEGGPRPGRRGDARQRPGAEGHHPAAGAGAGLHDGDARHRQVLPDPRRAPRPAGLHARWAGRRGTGLPRSDHRCQQRHREGHQAGPGDGHRVRHDGAARRGQAGHRRPRALPRPRVRPGPQLLRGHRRAGRRRGVPVDRHRPPGGVRRPGGQP